jgi:hypothetical protein
MERWCCVEAKTFVFTVVEGASVVRVEERRRKSLGLVLLGAHSIGWLFSTLESVLRFSGKDFVRSFREGSKVIIVRRGGNAAGRFIEVAAYALGGLRGIIYIPEGWNGWGWSRFLAELGKVRDFLIESAGKDMVRLGPLPTKERVDGDGAITDAATDSKGSDSAPSYAEVLCTGSRRPEKERLKQDQPVHPLGKDHHERYVSENVKGVRRLPKSEVQLRAAVRGKSECSFGETNVGFQLIGGKDTLPSLLIWQSQLEKLKIDVDRALSSVREGLLLVGPGYKPNGDRRKRKKNRKKKYRRTRWVPKTPMPNPSGPTADLVALPAVRPTSALGSGGQEKVPESVVSSDGTGHPPLTITFSENLLDESVSRTEWGSRPEIIAVAVREEREEMGLARSMGPIVGSTEADGGVSSPLEIQAPVMELGTGSVINAVDTVFSPPLLYAGGSHVVPAPESVTSQLDSSDRSELPVSILEVLPKVPLVPASALMDSENVLVVWAGRSPLDSPVPSGISPSVTMCENAPITLFPPSGLGHTNGLELVVLPEEVPSPLCCCPSENLRGFSGKKSSKDFLTAILEYSHSVGVTCDGYEGQLSAVFEAILAENDKKESGSCLKVGNKYTRELNKLSCSINYDSRSGSTSQSRCKGRAL